MPDDIEVSTEPEKKDETPVSFIENDGETFVQLGADEKKDDRTDERWREAEANQNRLAADLADIRMRLAGGGSSPQAGPASSPDPWQPQLDAISERERALGIQWEAYRKAGKLDQTMLEEFDKKSRDLQQQRHNIGAERALQGLLPQLVQQTQQAQFRAEYSDVQSNPNANRWARGHYDMLVAQGAPDSPETVRLAMNAARAQFRIGNGRMAPTERDRQQFTGFSGNSGRRNVGQKDNVVKMGKSEKIMAMAMYGDRVNGDEKKAYSQWAKGPGIRAQKAAQKARNQRTG